MPGAIATLSTPTSSNVGHSRSMSWDARRRVPSEVLGAAALAPKPTPK
jgi:hypothetical protein